ncbi:hypothetical protein [Streptomyces sp. PH10-H1]|uniref:hypothetical protein n=1 Tax=Streptomyces sp. PH10-H1 TaxID=3046212 RepID=UPI0024BB4378|nr:hypothetical protein [Streptomyces sp. PH10-H1]MDJ0347516.1 hypothetical protein [Streptomyces sp. PH10-H1]
MLAFGVFAVLLGVLPGQWWGRLLAAAAGLAVGVIVVRAGRRLHRNLHAADDNRDDGPQDRT